MQRVNRLLQMSTFFDLSFRLCLFEDTWCSLSEELQYQKWIKTKFSGMSKSWTVKKTDKGM